MERVVEIKYKVYDIVRGLLVIPVDSYGYNKYYTHYDTMDEALNAVTENDDDDMVILPVALNSWE